MPLEAVNDSYILPHRMGAPPVYVVGAPGVLKNDIPNNGVMLLPLNPNCTPHGGTVSWTGNGGFEYRPASNMFTGTDTFQYYLQQGTAMSAPATVTVKIVNHAPEAAPDSYVYTASPFIVAANDGVLKNDYDPQGVAGLTANLNTGAAHGAVVLSPDGAFTYTADGAPQNDSFTYYARDSAMVMSNIVTVTLKFVV